MNAFDKIMLKSLNIRQMRKIGQLPKTLKKQQKPKHKK